MERLWGEIESIMWKIINAVMNLIKSYLYLYVKLLWGAKYGGPSVQ